MIPYVLLGWATLLAVAAPRLLLRSPWTDRAPRLGVLAWQAASGSLVTAVVFAGVALAVPLSVLSSGLAELLAHCAMLLREAYRSPASVAVAATGLLLAAGVVLRLGYVFGSQSFEAARRRHAHGEALSLLGRPHAALGAVVVDHATPAAYCLPGRRGLIVVTTGALAALDDEEVQAVLEHERAHLRARHHLAVAAAAATARAFPMVPLLAAAAEQIPRLVEMAADDTAGARGGRGRVARALVALAGAGAPAGALAAGGPTSVARVRRLLDPAAPLPRGAAIAGVLSALALLVGPVAVAVAPAALAGTMPRCVAEAPPHA